jgi:hypothetical protein
MRGKRGWLKGCLGGGGRVEFGGLVIKIDEKREFALF